MCSGVGDFMAHSIVGNSGQTFQLKNKFSKKKDSYKIKTKRQTPPNDIIEPIELIKLKVA